MKRQRLLLVWGFSALVVAVPASAAPRFEQLVDRTAVYAGDRLRYTIVLTIDKDTQLALEDFERKNINFAPLVVDDMTVSSTVLATGETQYRIEYRLSNYETGARSIELPRIIFRYQAGGQGNDPRPATQEMAIPPLPIAVRSTLNQPLEDSWIHESLPTTVPSMPWSVLVLVGAAVAGLLVSSLPAWAWLFGRFKAWKASRDQPSWRQFLGHWAASLDALGQSGQDGDVKERFVKLEHHVREYIMQAWQLRVAGLTPAQLGQRLDARGVAPELRQTLESVVGEAQNCRYAPDQPGTWEESFRKSLDSLRALARA